MKVYHYIRMRDWEEAQEEAQRKNIEPTLNPRRRLGRNESRAYETIALFALTDPAPPEWTENKDFPLAWPYLMNHVGEMLVEIEVRESDPGVFVIDWSHIENYLTPDNIKDASRPNAEASYYETNIPLKDYLSRKQVLNYNLPEVLITHEVPFSDIKISEKQPLLELRLEELGRNPEATALVAMQKRLLESARRIPGMSVWYENYNRHKESSEQNRASRR